MLIDIIGEIGSGLGVYMDPEQTFSKPESGSVTLIIGIDCWTKYGYMYFVLRLHTSYNHELT